jgi:hypothetical protein
VLESLASSAAHAVYAEADECAGSVSIEKYEVYICAILKATFSNSTPSHNSFCFLEVNHEKENSDGTRTVCVRFKKNFTLTGKLSQYHAFEISTGN